MKNRIDYLPAILTLLAALISCVVTIIYRYDMTVSLIIVLVSSVVFYIFGIIIRFICLSYLISSAEAEIAEEEKKAETQSEQDTEKEKAETETVDKEE